MEVFYDGKTAGARMGSDLMGAGIRDFYLSPGEYISEVFGKNGDVIDTVGFVTTSG